MSPLGARLSPAGQRDTSGSRNYQQLLKDVEGIVPLLKEEDPNAEKLRRLPDRVVEALHSLRVFDVVKPAVHGGLQLSPSILFDVTSALAHGSASAAWVVGNLAVHHMHLAFFPERAQQDVWGADASAQIASSNIFKAGRAAEAAGGYMLRGRWPFASGILHSKWSIFGAEVAAADGAIEARYFLLPKEDYVILDTWHTTGLRGTGSTDVQIELPVFVPGERTVSQIEVAKTTAKGLLLHPDPQFRFPYSAGGVYILVGTLHGTAKGALDQLVEETKMGTSRTGGTSLAKDPNLQNSISEAAAHLDAVQALVIRNIEETSRLLESGVSCNDMTSVRLRRDAAFCAKLCVKAMDIIFAARGGSALYEKSPLQRAWRDVHAGAAHMAIRWETVGQAFGRVRLGLESGMPGLDV